jgi:integrase
VRNALSSAERDELVTRNVAKLVQIPTPRYKVGKGLAVSDVATLLAEARTTPLYALYLVAATLGLRRGELLGLRWQDLDLERGALTVAQTVQRVGGRLVVDDMKSEASDATVPLPKLTRRELLDTGTGRTRSASTRGDLARARSRVPDERRHADGAA